MKRFAIIGVGGYIAPRHLQAICDTKNKLVAAMDISDSVGILDKYFPEADFFTEFERFERHLEKLHREGQGIDYLVVCTPNYLHDAHIRLGLRVGADVICEKPVTIKPHNLKAISELAKNFNRRVYTILQLRIHPMTNQILNMAITEQALRHDVEVEYIAPRGRWYDYSWKGNDEKSGGLIYNLGIHFIDLAVYLFGKPVGKQYLYYSKPDVAKGKLRLDRALVKWELSYITGIKPQRLFRVDNEIYDFSNAFDGLHTKCYESILKGEDLFDIDTAYDSIKLADDLRNDTRNGNSR
jgi:UDP-N-acetyl-2-amino-2-deoxyglucuronate dehydrogenase